MQATTIGIDLAKNVFRVHGVDGAGKTVLRKKVTRAQLLPLLANLGPCLVGMEACSGAHYWAREIEKLGHQARLMNPRFVTLRQDQQERRQRCRGNLRGGQPSRDALCSD